MLPKKHVFYPKSFLISFLGFIFSTWNIVGASADYCPTGSCTLFANFSILGISLWWFGAFYFAILLTLCLFGLARIAKPLTTFGLISDLILLLIMLFTIPCNFCVIIAIFIGLSYLSIRYETRKITHTFPLPKLLILWGLILIMVCGNIFINSIATWKLVPAKSTQNIQVYFSPSCEACTKLIQQQWDNPNIAWYPVQENEDDIWFIKFIQNAYENGDNLNEALMKSKSSPLIAEASIFDCFSIEHWVLQLRLWRNAAHIMRSGQNNLPFIEYNGLPSTLTNTVPSTNNDTSPLNDILGTVDAFCGGKTTKPCLD